MRYPLPKMLSPVLLLILFFTLISNTSHAQTKTRIHGRVFNDFTKEPIAFASIFWKKAGFGINSDSSGHFTILASPLAKDSLVVSFVGFAPLYKAYQPQARDSVWLDLVMNELKMGSTVEVKSKFNKGLRWWKQVVAHKSRNNPYTFQQYACELYSKTEIDINNISKQYFTDKKLLKPFLFLLDNIDSLSDQRPFLPIYMTETLSDYYASSDPHKTREEIRAAKTDGMKNESVLQFLGGMNQKINIYDNSSVLFGKEFISPISDWGDKYYDFKGADTQVIGGTKYFHLLFSPKHPGENTFSGDCWIHSENWGILKINLSISATANINFVNRLSLVQEFALQSNQQWMFAKDKAVMDFAPLGKDKLSFIARKTNSYRNIRINDPSIHARLQQNHQRDEVIVSETAREQEKDFWPSQRHEALSENERKIYKMMDTIKTIPAFISYTKALTFIFDGHKKLGAIEIGPWYKWISGNQKEKVRMRFDLGTTDEFSKYLRLHGYLAYGFKDNTFKGRFDVTYKLPGNKGITFFSSYTNDLDNGRVRYNDEDITTDNLFSQLIRRPGVPQKFLGVEEVKFAVTKEWPNKLSVQPFFTRSDFETFAPLPPRRTLLRRAAQQNITNAEIGLKIRYAPGEKTFSRHRKDTRIRSSLPVLELRAAFSSDGLLGSEYAYERVGMNISQNFRIPRWGKLNYMLYGGKIFTNEGLPFMLMEIHPGNEIYYYNKQSFNLMNRFEYISDRYAGINIEHNIEKKFLNLIPFMRKSNMRQFWNFKAVWGDMSTASRILNHIEYTNEYKLRSLRGGIYTEIGTGFENIFKLLRIDFVWRHAPLRKLPPNVNPALFKSNTQDFGIFGSVRFQL
ncbi:MAG: carboxypeptidase-like regulatory domain-containing protein [Chitinophagaceae bacterium]|nr:carboxypeptidase-like regulatory domain-containing protein [Chitinophagaceae bacterium]